MKTMPSHLPPLPPGYIYLGLGHSFKVVPFSRFTGLFLHEGCGWENEDSLSGSSDKYHYAALADSEIAKFNANPVVDLSTLNIGTRVRRRDGVVGVFEGKANPGGRVYNVGYPDNSGLDSTDHYKNGKRMTDRTCSDDIFGVLPDVAPTLDARVAALEKELAGLKAQQSKPSDVACAAPVKWEPYNGVGFIYKNYLRKTLLINPLSCTQDANHAAAGSVFKTREACDSAAPYRTFYSRLLNLAAELNPSGLVGGEFFVVPDEDAKWSAYRVARPEERGITTVFETYAAATQAADILNRDGWKVPSLEGSK